MCKGKVLLGMVVGVAAVAVLSLALIGAKADAQCYGSAKTTAVNTAADAPVNCPLSKVANATVSPGPAGRTSDAPACCGTCSKASSCAAKKEGTQTACCDQAGTAACCAADKVKATQGKTLPTLQQVHARQLPGAITSIDAALKALEKGDRASVIRHLTAARLNIQTAHFALAKHVGPTFVNAVCPLMGSPIKPEKVTASLTREYKGQKVGFCCAGWPEEWDKLTDAQKEAKLEKAKPTPLTGLKLKP